MLSVFYSTLSIKSWLKKVFFLFQIIFIIYSSCPFLAARVSAWIPGIGAALFVFTLSSLLRTSLSDPGIIPRASALEAAYIEQQISVPGQIFRDT